MAEAKTKLTDSSVADFLTASEPADRRDDAAALDALFRKATGFAPRMWGPVSLAMGATAMLMSVAIAVNGWQQGSLHARQNIRFTLGQTLHRRPRFWPVRATTGSENNDYISNA